MKIQFRVDLITLIKEEFSILNIKEIIILSKYKFHMREIN
jgi:hypothetical protein